MTPTGQLVRRSEDLLLRYFQTGLRALVAAGPSQGDEAGEECSKLVDNQNVLIMVSYDYLAMLSCGCLVETMQIIING